MLPEYITIGCYDYKVVVTDEIMLLEGRSCLGMIGYEEKLIKIKSNLSPQAQEQTFWHEVVHGIIHYRNVNPQVADEETLVDEIATGLYGIMKNNGLLPGQKQQGTP